MKASIISSTLAVAASFFIGTAVAQSGTAKFVTTWVEGGLQRYRFTFSGVSTDNYGQDFLNGLRSVGGITENWQCWYDPQNGWTFDDSEIEGCGGLDVIYGGVHAVTGQFFDELGLESARVAFGGCD